jgi:hypothetical protein
VIEAARSVTAALWNMRHQTMCEHHNTVGLSDTWTSDDRYTSQLSVDKQKRMPTALGILELSPTSILTKLEDSCLLNSTGIRNINLDVAVDIN